MLLDLNNTLSYIKIVFVILNMRGKIIILYKLKGGIKVNEVYEYLKSIGTYYLATSEGDQPRVRPFGTIDIFEGKLYIQTGNVKNVFAQMKKNPKIEICAVGEDNTWIRVTATAVQDDRVEARQHMLDEYPNLKSMYAADDGNCEVLYLKNATATVYSFTEKPKTIKF